MFADALLSVPLFAGLGPELRNEVAERATVARVEAGEWLFRQGEPAASLYVVLPGRLEEPSILQELTDA
jgi:CRP-like cAMP-binding protein